MSEKPVIDPIEYARTVKIPWDEFYVNHEDLDVGLACALQDLKKAAETICGIVKFIEYAIERKKHE